MTFDDEHAGDDRGATTYVGTPYECMAFLDSFFGAMRAFAVGAGTAMRERGEDSSVWDDGERILDRRVFEISVSPLRMVAKSEFRPETVTRGMMVKTALDLAHVMMDEVRDANDGGES